MENSNISRPETLTQRQDSARLNGAAHDSPAGMERESLRTPSKVLQALRRALLDSKNENQQLAEEMTALKEQMDSREMSWEKKHHELLEEKENLAKTLFQAKNDIKGMMNAAKERQQHFDNRCREMDLIMTQKEEEVHSMKKKLHLQRQEITKVIKHWTTEYDQVTKFWKEEHNKVSAACEKKSAELESSFERTIAKLHAEWESRFVCQEMAATDLKMVQEDLERKVRQVTLEKSDLIATIKENKKALFDNMVKISQKEVALRKNDTDWRAKYDALEHQFAVKQTSSEKLHQEIEDEWRRKSRQMEEDIKLLMQKNAELQELASKSDKEKKKMRKEEKKAQKETEKRLKKERKEEEEREKREKNEHERKEKERLKNEKKEQEERQKKDKKEQKEKEEREKKEKKEHERKEKERLKNEKKEKEEREKKEKKERKDKEKREKKEKKERDKKEKERGATSSFSS